MRDEAHSPQTDIRYPIKGIPSAGEVREVAPGISWIRMPLPFKLNHVNLWLLDDGDGWTVVDTGIASHETEEAWREILAKGAAGKPLKRMIVTHFHPDHVGFAGWLARHCGAELWMPFGEWAFARMRSVDGRNGTLEGFQHFYRTAGFDPGLMKLVEGRSKDYARRITPVPRAVRPIVDGEVIPVGGRAWRVIMGAGHAFEHASLHCEELRILISADQILPQITPNISVGPYVPEADPLRLYVASLDKFRALAGDTLVLPGHRRPFTGLHARLEELAHHHDRRLEETWAACARPRTGLGVLRYLFDRELDDHQVFFAIGESLAHLHFLLARGRMERRVSADGVYLFQRKDAETDRR